MAHHSLLSLASVLAITALVGCDSGKPGSDGTIDTGTTITGPEDNDQDGYTTDDDCNDADGTVHPGATEVCDGIDNNCDGTVDEGVTTTYYRDADGDGFGDPDTSEDACETPTGYVPNGNDCDDASADAFPGNVEVCDGIDNDCNGEIDEGVTTTYYADTDLDGYGDPDASLDSCTQPTGYVVDDTDCDDTTAQAFPGNLEVCDEIDNNCDGSVDEGVTTTYYADTDSDTFGDPSVTQEACSLPAGYADRAGDCDDTATEVNPDSDEVCDLIDNDCDGNTDEPDALDASDWYADSDTDGYGDPATTMHRCFQPTGYVSDNTDCDDTNATTYPGADEYCDGEDDDCDGTIDEDDAVDVSTWYADSDSDSYGDAAVTDIDCYQPTGYVADNTDCDDTNATTYPGADEYCDGEDDDCDGTIDEDDAVDVSTWYADSDSDGYGDSAVTDIDCYQPTGYVSDDTDCDDTNATTYPGADEYCDGEDDDCDGTIDEDDAVDASTWYIDYDSDGYGNASMDDIACYQPSGYVADDTDCDDGDATQYPGADEVCNGEDDDCDGDVDEDGGVTDGDTYYGDADSDSLGDIDTTIQACSAPSGYVDNYYDCDDTNSAEPVVVDGSLGSSTGAGTLASPYDSIQDGIDDANDCVIVYSGTYKEAVDLSGKSIDLWGVEGEEFTTIDADGTVCSASSPTGCEPTLTIASGAGAAPSIHGFTVTGGTGYTTSSSTSTTCADSSSSHGGDNTCTVNIYEYCGGGAYINGDDPSFSDVVFEDNNLPEFEQTATGDFTQNWLYSYGGAICAVDAVVDLEDVGVFSNFADQGGGIFGEGASTYTVVHSDIKENSAGDGAGANLSDASSLSATNSTWACNDADTDGGGVFAEDSSTSVSLTNTVFYLDTSATGTTHGAAIYGDSSASVAMMNSAVYTNISAFALYGGTTGTFSYNDIYNTASGTYTYGGSYATGLGDINSNPDFASATCDGNPNNDDFSLNSTSPAIDAGDPSSTYYDTDGTRNDIGSYGGPNGDW